LPKLTPTPGAEGKGGEVVKETPPVIKEPPAEPSEVQSGVNPLTSARQGWLKELRQVVGLSGINSKLRRRWTRALQLAGEQGIPDNAVRLATEILNKPRALSDIETAGMVLALQRLRNEHSKFSKRINESNYDAVAEGMAARLSTIEAEFEAITRALHESGTEKGRALASQKLTINEDFNLVTVKTRARIAKGAELTTKESKQVEELVKKLAEKDAKLADFLGQMNAMRAQQVINEATTEKKTTRQKRTKKTRAQLSNRFVELMSAGCN